MVATINNFFVMKNIKAYSTIIRSFAPYYFSNY